MWTLGIEDGGMCVCVGGGGGHGGTASLNVGTYCQTFSGFGHPSILFHFSFNFSIQDDVQK